jgi:surface protein
MFYQAIAITGVHLFDISNTTSLSRLFRNCQQLQELPNFNTSHITNMYTMFSQCKTLTEIPHYDTSNITNMNSFCSGCTGITTAPHFVTSGVTTMYEMFRNCTSITGIPMYDVSNVTNFNGMFASCWNLEQATLSGTAYDISYEDCNLPNAEIENIFNGLATVSGKTINVAGNPGTPTLTSGQLLIATSKGWTVAT